MQKTTWSKNLDDDCPLSFAHAVIFPSIVLRKVWSERPLVQLKIRTFFVCELETKGSESLKRSNSSRTYEFPSKSTPTPRLRNQSMQHPRLSAVCAPSRYQVKLPWTGSATVWQRPGHLAALSPATKLRGNSDASSRAWRSCRKRRASSTAIVAFWSWCFPARPTVMCKSFLEKYGINWPNGILDKVSDACRTLSEDDWPWDQCLHRACVIQALTQSSFARSSSTFNPSGGWVTVIAGIPLWWSSGKDTNNVYGADLKNSTLLPCNLF